MKEELQGKLVEILTSIQTAAGKASDFAIEQLPDIAQSYVAYGRALHSFIFAAFLVGMCAALFVALRYGFLNKEAVYKGSVSYMQGDWLSERVIAAVFGTLGTIAMTVGLLANAGGFLLVWLAPKVWLLKEIASLLK